MNIQKSKKVYACWIAAIQLPLTGPVVCWAEDEVKPETHTYRLETAEGSMDAVTAKTAVSGPKDIDDPVYGRLTVLEQSDIGIDVNVDQNPTKTSAAASWQGGWSARVSVLSKLPKTPDLGRLPKGSGRLEELGVPPKEEYDSISAAINSTEATYIFWKNGRAVALRTEDRAGGARAAVALATDRSCLDWWSVVHFLSGCITQSTTLLIWWEFVEPHIWPGFNESLLNQICDVIVGWLCDVLI